MQNLAHSASFESLDKDAPSKAGTKHLGDWFAEAANKAGLINCTAHDLRKAGAKRCAEAGASVNQMMAIFGWVRADMAIKYTFGTSKKRMALDGAKGIVREETGNVYSLTQ
jgi:hypothetical protein